MKNDAQIYMDHSATTPVDPMVFNAMIPYFTDKFGNPSSVHARGGRPKALEKARDQVASLINAKSGEIFLPAAARGQSSHVSYMLSNAQKGKR